MKSLLILGAMLLLFWLLYDRGFLTVSKKRALYFVGKVEAATYKNCSGTIHRIFRPKENREYCFSLDLQLNKGAVTMELLDRREHCLLRLNSYHNRGTVSLERGEKYYLLVRFEEAEGSHKLMKQ